MFFRLETDTNKRNPVGQGEMGVKVGMVVDGWRLISSSRGLSLKLRTGVSIRPAIHLYRTYTARFPNP